MKITATIITLNEERNIARAMESLRCCDQIVVLDSGSVDRTVELATKLGAVVVEDSWRGYAKSPRPLSSISSPIFWRRSRSTTIVRPRRHTAPLAAAATKSSSAYSPEKREPMGWGRNMRSRWTTMLISGCSMQPTGLCS